MIILKIWLVTILIAVLSFILFSVEIVIYSKAKGYRSARKMSFVERMWGYFKILLQCCIPLYNLFVALSFFLCLFCEEFKQSAFDNAVQKGDIKKI
jgi:hypothetical protein